MFLFLPPLFYRVVVHSESEFILFFRLSYWFLFFLPSEAAAKHDCGSLRPIGLFDFASKGPELDEFCFFGCAGGPFDFNDE